MASRSVLIGIIVGVAVAGIIGYAVFQMSNQPPVTVPQDQEGEQQGVFADALAYTSEPVEIDQQKEYAVTRSQMGFTGLSGTDTRRCFSLRARA